MKGPTGRAREGSDWRVHRMRRIKGFYKGNGGGADVILSMFSLTPSLIFPLSFSGTWWTHAEVVAVLT